MSAILCINLLGDFKLSYFNKQIINVDSSRMQELLAYLLLHQHAPQSREYISFLFWPDSSEKQARTNLRQLLHHLQINLPDAEKFIISNAKTVQWNTDSPFLLDVSEFKRFFTEAGKAGKVAEKENNLLQAIQAYKGDLLKTCYHEWITADREQLKGEYLKTLGNLINLLENKRDYAAAISYGHLLLQTDSLYEPIYRQLMRLHACNNDRAGALQVYQKCADTFRKELGVDPDQETKSIYNRLFSNKEDKKIPQTTAIYFEPQDDWPLVGRVEEWKTLQNVWSSTLTGRKQLMIIEGEPGIGKTRLGLEYVNWIYKQGHSIAHTRCFETANALSYAPITELLNTRLIRNALPKLDPIWLSEVSRILPSLLVEQRNLAHPGPLQESWQRQKFFEALSRAFTIDGKQKVIYIDDLQWCDHETILWLHFFLHFETNAPVLLLCTMRSTEYALNEPLKKLLSGLRKELQLSTLRLQPLDKQDTLLLAKAVASSDEGQRVSTELFSETEGNPLFIVESIRKGALQNKDESNLSHSSYSPFGISPKVNEVIAARFTKLSAQATEILSLGAVIGREFSFDVLLHSANRLEGELIPALEELMQHYIIREQPSGKFDFSHDKLREVAYLGMSNARRRWLHRTVAETIEKLNVPQMGTLSNRLAYHYDLAGIAGKAIRYYQQAATYAQEIFANHQAITFLKRAIVLAEDMSEVNNPDQLSTVLHTQLAIALVHLKGYGASDVYQACERILILSKRLTKMPDDQVLRMLAINRVVNADFSSGYELGQELLSLAKHKGNAILEVEAYYVLGVAQHWRGKYQEAKLHFNEVLTRYDPKQSTTHIQLYGQDPALVCRIRLANVLLALGEVEEAQALGAQSLKAAIDCGHPFSLGYVQTWHAWLNNVQGKVRESRQEAENSVAYSTKYEFPFWHTWSSLLLGWAISENGEQEKGISLMEESLDFAYSSNSLAGLSYFWCLLASALSNRGEFIKALQLIEKAQTQIEKTGERWMEAELYRIKAEIILKRNPADLSVAMDSYKQAIAIARGQGAVYLEQKALLSLNRITTRV